MSVKTLSIFHLAYNYLPININNNKIQYYNFLFLFSDDDYLPQEAPSVSTSMRRNNQGVCLKDQTVRVMTKCLFNKCNTKPRCSKAQIMNQIRRFIHEKDVKSWWIKLAKCLHVRVSLKTVSVFTKCYLMAIPT
uniref:Uncharacterized protein n=1 Tax=Cacopsylla melanoneura TaxID=428564 RepID=A0A8D8ZGA2_9HEMI